MQVSPYAHCNYLSHLYVRYLYRVMWQMYCFFDWDHLRKTYTPEKLPLESICRPMSVQIVRFLRSQIIFTSHLLHVLLTLHECLFIGLRHNTWFSYLFNYLKGPESLCYTHPLPICSGKLIFISSSFSYSSLI